jgi:hypothetical protein
VASPSGAAAGELAAVDKPFSGAGAGDSFAGCGQSGCGPATGAGSWAVVSGTVLPAVAGFSSRAAAGSVTVVAATASAAGSAAASGCAWLN